MKDVTALSDVPHVLIEDRFAQIPEALLYDPEISAEAVRVFGVLLRHGQDPRNCFPSHRRIAERIGKQPSSVPRWIRELEAHGWIQRFPRVNAEGQTSNGYFVRCRAGEHTPRAGEQGTPARDGAYPPRSGARGKRAIEREQKNDCAVALLGAEDVCSSCEGTGWIDVEDRSGVAPCPDCDRVAS